MEHTDSRNEQTINSRRPRLVRSLVLAVGLGLLLQGTALAGDFRRGPARKLRTKVGVRGVSVRVNRGRRVVQIPIAKAPRARAHDVRKHLGGSQAGGSKLPNLTKDAALEKRIGQYDPRGSDRPQPESGSNAPDFSKRQELASKDPGSQKNDPAANGPKVEDRMAEKLAGWGRRDDPLDRPQPGATDGEPTPPTQGPRAPVDSRTMEGETEEEKAAAAAAAAAAKAEAEAVAAAAAAKAKAKAIEEAAKKAAKAAEQAVRLARGPKVTVKYIAGKVWDAITPDTDPQTDAEKEAQSVYEAGRNAVAGLRGYDPDGKGPGPAPDITDDQLYKNVHPSKTPRTVRKKSTLEGDEYSQSKGRAPDEVDAKTRGEIQEQKAARYSTPKQDDGTSSGGGSSSAPVNKVKVFDTMTQPTARDGGRGEGGRMDKRD